MGRFSFPLFCELRLEVFYGNKELCSKEIEKSFHAVDPESEMPNASSGSSGETLYKLGHDPKIWLEKLPHDPKTRDTVSHEAAHVVGWVSRTTGISDVEFDGYLIGHIVRMIEIAAQKRK